MFLIKNKNVYPALEIYVKLQFPTAFRMYDQYANPVVRCHINFTFDSKFYFLLKSFTKNNKEWGGGYSQDHCFFATLGTFRPLAEVKFCF